MEYEIRSGSTDYQKLLTMKLCFLAGVETLFAFVLLTFLAPSDPLLKDYLPLLLLSFVALSVWSAMIGRTGKVNPLPLYGMFALILLVGVFFFTVNLVFMAGAFVFLYWRMNAHLQDMESNIEISSGAWAIFLAIAAASMMTSPMRGMENGTPVIVSIFLYLLLTVSVTPIQRMMTHGSGKRPYYVPLTLMGAIAGVATVLGLMSFVLMQGIYWVFSKIFWVFSFAVDPIYNAIVHLRDLVSSLFNQVYGEGEEGSFEKGEVETGEPLPISQGMSLDWLVLVSGIIAVLLIILYFYMKRRGTAASLRERKGFSVQAYPDKPVDGPRSSDYDYSQADDRIRESVTEFERFAHSKNAGRKTDEDLRGWFRRLGLEDEERFFTIYEQVRYGKGGVSPEGGDFFVHRMEFHTSSLLHPFEEKEA
ncbi:hypothetical protein ANABIO32_38230 [Rossellomorea marisflavi]|uniref:hypothetical protein n=1 Tax=Rossellomorea marisflavi TaxID=189381 RepID=UPI0025C75ECC|nr:hypothetical protein [Rossellomorea marisflavi]GLI86051.1 hypothetical protein ANABIO32_38230 [Rossellomorea marisflavi]